MEEAREKGGRECVETGGHFETEIERDVERGWKKLVETLKQKEREKGEKGSNWQIH